MPETIRVLGIDTSLRSTGAAVVEARGNSVVPVEYCTIKNPAKLTVSKCLARLSDELRAMIERTQPVEVAVEGAFFNKNARTAMILGQARGVAIAAGACAGLPVYEYAPRKVKSAVVGNGNASKDQVAKMVMSLTGITEQPQEDAGDALAIAICHLHNRSQHEILGPKEI